MSLTLEINGTDFTAKWRPYESHWTRRAYMGEASGESEFVIDDDDGTINHADFATYKVVRVWEDASGADFCMFEGRITTKRLGRGPKRDGLAMRWVITAADSNYELRGIRISDSHRPVESDRERVLAFRFGYLNGLASTNINARASTEIDGTYVEAADLITLPAEDFQDTFPDEVFRRIAEMAAKTFFVFIDGDAVKHLYYALHTDDQLVADITITDDGTADGVDSYAPDVSDSSGAHDGLQIITGASLRYGDDEFLAMDDVAGGEADHDKWEEHFTDDFIINEESALNFIQNTVAARSNEDFTFTVTWLMRAEHAHRLQAGYVTGIRLASANVPTEIDQRATQVSHQPLYPDANGAAVYRVTADFGFPRGRPFQRHIHIKRPTLAKPVETTAGLAFEGCRLSTNAGGDTVAAVPAGAAPGMLLVANGLLNGIGVFDDKPSIPGGWTAIGSGGSAGSGAQNIGQRGAWKIMVAGDEDGVQWLDAHSVIVSAWSGFDTADPIGDIDGNSGSGSTATWSALAPEVTDGSSWFVAFGGHDGDNSFGDNSMSGSPAMSTMCGAGHHGGWRTAAGSASWGSHTVGAANSDDYVWTAYEIRAGETHTANSGGHEESTGTSTDQARADHGHAFRRTSAPTASDDSADGYRRFDEWYVVNDYDDPTNIIASYVCIDPTVGAAVWDLRGEIATINYVIDGGGPVITTGDKGDVGINFPCTILSVQTRSRTTGSVVVDIKKSTTAGYDGSLTSICASAKPTLSSAKIATDSTLTGWTTAIAAGDVLSYNVDSATTVTRVTVSLQVRKT